MKKKLLCLGLAFMLLFGCCGCGVVENIKIDKKGNLSGTFITYLTEEEILSIGGDPDVFGKVTVDGVEYRASEDAMTFDDEDREIYKPTGFCQPVREYEDDQKETAEDNDMDEEELLAAYQFLDINITFPYEVVNTNGELSKDKKTVTFHLLDFLAGGDKDAVVYAYTKNAPEVKNDKTAPSIKGVKNKKTYKKAVTLTVADMGSGLKSVTVNGKSVALPKVAKGYKISKNGTYKVVATDNKGNKKTVSFTIKKS